MTPVEAAVLERPTAQPVGRLRATTPFRVLVADDQPDVIEAIRLLLGARDFVVIGATTPAEAVAVAAAHPIDAALIDLQLRQGPQRRASRAWTSWPRSSAPTRHCLSS